MSISVKITGPLVKPGALRKLGADMAERLQKEVALAAVDAANNARRSVREPGQGRTYEKANPNRTHRASAPGEAPAGDTGRLIASIKTAKDGDGFIVGSDVRYSLFLEYGTRTIRERPFFRPALKKAVAKWTKRVENLVGAKNVRLMDVMDD